MVRVQKETIITMIRILHLNAKILQMSSAPEDENHKIERYYFHIADELKLIELCNVW